MVIVTLCLTESFSLAMTRDLPFHTRIIAAELKRRQTKNPLYSLRSFAAFLGWHPSALSRILANKQDLSLKACASVLKKLNLDEDDQKLFIASVAENKMNQAFVILTRAIGYSSTVVGFDPREQTFIRPGNKERIAAKTVLSFSEDLICVMDQNGRFLFSNEALARVLDAVPCDLIGKQWSEVGLPPKIADQLIEQQNSFCRVAEQQKVSFGGFTETGRTRYDRLISPIFNEENELKAFRSVFRDTTESQFLWDCAERLAPLASLETTLERALRVAIPVFSDNCAILLKSSLNTLETKSTNAASGALVSELLKRDDFVFDATKIWNRSTNDTADEGESVYQFPLLTQSTAIGVIFFIRSEQKWVEGPAALSVGTDLSKIVARAISNSQLL